MPLANRDLKGIHFAMEFLEAQQKKQLGGNKNIISAEGKDVIIIGGGDTGCDCIATSLRQGAKSITTFEILPEPPQKRAEDNPWPQWPKVFRLVILLLKFSNIFYLNFIYSVLTMVMRKFVLNLAKILANTAPPLRNSLVKMVKSKVLKPWKLHGQNHPLANGA